MRGPSQIFSMNSYFGRCWSMLVEEAVKTTKQMTVDVVGDVRVKGSRISRSVHFLLRVKELI